MLSSLHTKKTHTHTTRLTNAYPNAYPKLNIHNKIRIKMNAKGRHLSDIENMLSKPLCPCKIFMSSTQCTANPVNGGKNYLRVHQLILTDSPKSPNSTELQDSLDFQKLGVSPNF